MSSKNPISFAFSVLFEIAAVVAIVSVLPRVNLRPSASASQSPLETLPLQTTDLRIQSPQPWTANTRSFDQQNNQSLPPVIEAAPTNPQYVEQQLDRASQRLLNTVGGAVNQASQDWLRPVQQSAPIGTGVPQSQVIGAGYTPDTSHTPQQLPTQQPSIQPPVVQPPVVQQPVVQQPLLQQGPAQQTAQQTAHKPARAPAATQRTPEQRPWLRY